MVELGGQGLVVRQDERGALHLGDDPGHGEGLAGAGDAEQDLVFFTCGETGHQLADGARLVALGRIGGGELEVHPNRIPSGKRRWRTSIYRRNRLYAV